MKRVFFKYTLKGLLQQLDSARADCQFLATSHAESLRGLHGEIDSLQRSNRQLQFQITFESDADRVNRLETAVDQLQLANTKCESQLEEQVRAKVIEQKIAIIFSATKVRNKTGQGALTGGSIAQAHWTAGGLVETDYWLVPNISGQSGEAE